MRKRIIPTQPAEAPPAGAQWLSLDDVAEVEVTSEDPAHPIEDALLPGQGTGWRASGSGKQTIRLLFRPAVTLTRIWIEFVEADSNRTQEFTLRWSADDGANYREVVRQQWNFSPQGATTETEDTVVDLAGVTTLELTIVPDISGGPARASLTQLKLA